MTARCLLIAIFPGLLTVLSLQCSDGPTRPSTFFLSVHVVDSFVGPVANQKVHISPLGLKGETNEDGFAVFALAPGDYFVDADVCCVGPGFIRYHVPVTVESDSAKVTLNACLACE